MSSPSRLLLFPCNGNAVEALDCLGTSWECIGFIDDAPERRGSTVSGIEVFDRTALSRWPDVHVLAVPGGPDSFRERRRVIEALDIRDERYARVIHPSANVSDRSEVGYNTLLMAGVVLTSNASVGNHCCVLPNSVVHHDSRIGDWTLMGAGVTIAGGTVIGENCYIGASSGIMNGLSVGERALVGFGSNVINDVESGTRVAGNPARVLD